jgi:alginate O-acetyltransferase complex protein AlgI
MLFLTAWFVVFAAVLYPVYWFVRVPRVRLWVLLVGCVTFHTAFAGPAGVLPIVVLGVVTFLAGLTRHRACCWLGIVLSAASLVFYKYTRFLCTAVVGTFVPSYGTWLESGFQGLLPAAPPLAISFFAFEFIHYLVDVGRGAPPVRSVRKFTLFAIFWPSIVAGPVKRYQDFLPALKRGLVGVGEGDVSAGVTRFGLGLVKKFAADTLTAWITFWGPQFERLDVSWRWLFVLFLALRILWDFSGYSDMAIGLARMHGVRLPENFNWPYLATSLTDFWQRWHMSLSLWIRDYVYIPLGGNRCGTARKLVNGLVAFGLCGLWHGAGWNFVVWGLLHGVGLAATSAYRAVLGERVVGPAWLVRPLAWAATMLFVGIGWVFFFYPLPDAFHKIQLLFGGC